MTHSQNSTQPIYPASLAKRMLVGAAIGLSLIPALLLSVDHPSTEWGNLWMVRPLIIVPLAGAMGGLCNYFFVHFHKPVGVNKTIAVILSGVVFIIGLWLGIVVGLDGTLWN
jgi:hypothetical protein